jgi:hypothetical protein
MKVSYVAELTRRRKVGVIATLLLAAAVIAGWAASTTIAPTAAAFDQSLASEMARKTEVGRLPLEGGKPGLIGSYEVTGTDPDGRPYPGATILDVALAPSGALELDWDNGRQLGIGQVTGNALVVASLNRGRTAILIMSINPDGSLSGNWLRRTDRGYKGTETWKRK